MMNQTHSLLSENHACIGPVHGQLPSMPPRTQHPITFYGLMTEHPRPWQRGKLGPSRSNLAGGLALGSLGLRASAGGSSHSGEL